MEVSNTIGKTIKLTVAVIFYVKADRIDRLKLLISRRNMERVCLKTRLIRPKLPGRLSTIVLGAIICGFYVGMGAMQCLK